MSNLQLSTEAFLHTKLPGTEPRPEGLQAHWSLNTKKGAGVEACPLLSQPGAVLTPLKMPSVFHRSCLPKQIKFTQLWSELSYLQSSGLRESLCACGHLLHQVFSQEGQSCLSLGFPHIGKCQPESVSCLPFTSQQPEVELLDRMVVSGFG